MKRSKISILILAAACFAAAIAPGCGVKSAPIPPEAARPQQILDLEAIPERRGIQLSWSRPENYASGQTMHDLAGFTIMRAEGQDQYQPIVEVPITDQERFQVASHFSYTDNTAAANQSYRYEVVSHTSDGYKSMPSNEAALEYIRPQPLLPASPTQYERAAPSAPAAGPHFHVAPPPPLPPTL